MKIWRARLFTLLLSCMPCLGFAQASSSSAPTPASAPPIQVHVYLDANGPLIQGETASIKVDMLTSSFFSDAPDMPELHVDGAYLKLSDETPGHLVDNIDGNSWSGVSRTYLLTSLVSGELEIPGFQITARVGPQQTPVAMQTKPLMLHVKRLVLPAGVDTALIARSVKLTQTITPKDSALHVGDTIIRRIEITADGAPAMLLPPITFKPVDGLELYPSPPQTHDVVGNQGGFLGGSRVDSVSYVIQRRGRYSLPPISVRWMDNQTHEWHESRVPGASFHAWWSSPAKPRFALPQQGFMPRLLEWFSSDLGIVVLLLLGLGLAGWWFRDRVTRARNRWRAWRDRRRHSERAAFVAIKRKQQGTSAATFAAAVDVWVRRAALEGAPLTMSDWCSRYGDADLRAQWTALQSSLYGNPSEAWSKKAIVDGIGRARKQWLGARRMAKRDVALPPLNPV